MQLVETAKIWYKKASTWVAGSIGTAIVTYALLPDKIQDSFPEWFLFSLGVIVIFGVPTAVAIKQKALHKE